MSAPRSPLRPRPAHASSPPTAPDPAPSPLSPSSFAWSCSVGPKFSPFATLGLDHGRAGFFSDATVSGSVFVREVPATDRRTRLAELRFHDARGPLTVRRVLSGRAAPASGWRIESARARLVRRCDVHGDCELLSITHEFNPPAHLDDDSPVFTTEHPRTAGAFAIAFSRGRVVRVAILGDPAPSPPDVLAPDGASLAGILQTPSGPRAVFRRGSSGRWTFADLRPADLSLDACRAPVSAARPALGTVEIPVRWSLMQPETTLRAELAADARDGACVRSLDGRATVEFAPVSLEISAEGDGEARGLLQSPRGIALVRCHPIR